MNNQELSHHDLLDWLNYDEFTGIFTWVRKPKGRRNVGDIADIMRDGSLYVTINIFGATYSAHRLAVFYMTGEWPADTVDHRDRNPQNNRWSNLRPCTGQQNAWNTKRSHTQNIESYGKGFLVRVQGRTAKAESMDQAIEIAKQLRFEVYGEFAFDYTNTTCD